VTEPTTLTATVPLLLFPFRIETRFVADVVNAGVAEGPVLLLRVYPDTVSVSAFESALTADEISAGQAYWTQLWLAGSPPLDADTARAPWRVLAATYGAQRAAWIALQLTPVNAADQPMAPTPAGQQPSPSPQFPSPPTRPSSYEQAPATLTLPSAWTVALYSGSDTRQVTGGPITPGLAVGFTPHDGTMPAGLPVDAGMSWLVDFDQAVAAGMALRIPLTAAEFSAGFDHIIVYGMAAGDTTDGAGVLTGLLDAHHYSEGLAFIPQGAPTKNTPDTSAGYSQQDPDYAVSFAVERSGPLTTAADGDGTQAAQLLGIPAATFAHVQYADGYGTRNGQDMMTALWPATLGYFMSQLMEPQFSVDDVGTARTYALANAIPRGPLPALRVGSTPYGILPVTSLALLAAQAPTAPTGGSPPPGPPQPSAADPRGALAGFLAQLLPVWQASVQFAPHIGATADPDSDLAQVLGMDASAVGFRARQVIGDTLMWNMLPFLGIEPQAWWVQHLSTGRTPLDAVGLTSWAPRIVRTSMGEQSFPVPYPNVQDGALSETEPLAADATVGSQQLNYIQWLATASAENIWAENYPGPQPTSVLYRVLRQSVLDEYVRLSGQAQADAGLLPASALLEQELVNTDPAAQDVTPAQIISRPVAAGSTVTWAQYLHDLQPQAGSPFVPLAELRASLGRLAVLPTAELGRLLTETLDACSHRLDVWITALATDILRAQRAGQAADAPAVYLGGYGWVENVRQATPAPVVTGAEAAAVQLLDTSRSAVGLPAVQQPDSSSGGFIHAPSMTQAAAGAVLRSGYLSHRGTSDEQLLAIDLSSERTSAALWLLAGIRQGQSLGALTGYQFEEGLHGLQLDAYIQPFRDAYPLVGTDLTAQTAAGPVQAPSQVVDGVKLNAAWESGALPAGGTWGAGLPQPTPPGNVTQNAVLGVLGQIADMLSALSDVSLAESVFQVMRGNLGRAGGMLAAISQGSQPPEPDFPATPRAGTDVTHRLMLLFTGPPVTPPAWAGVSTRPRATAEPWLSAWVASRLPDPTAVRCQVSWTTGTQNGAQPGLAVVSLSDLDIGPLDVLALANAGDQPQRAELENRIIYAANPPPDAQAISLSYTPAGPTAGAVPFSSLLAAAQAVRDMLGAARALAIGDFSLPEDDGAAGGGTIDLADLNNRASALLTQLNADIATLRTAITALQTASDATAPQAVSAALITASGYGISGSIPLPGQQESGLAAQAAQVLAQLSQNAAAAQQTSLPASTPQAALAVIAAIVGDDVQVLPHLTPPGLTALQTAFAESAAMLAVDPQAADRWLLQLSHIRPAAERLDVAAALTRLLGADKPALTVAQLPATPGDRWLGLPIDPANPPASGRVAIEAITPGDPSAATVLAGLLLDEWLDRIPVQATSTGVSFNYPEPMARTPQALLLAVCPDARPSWDGGLVTTILEEMLALAKIRAVDLSSLQQLGQLLPALCFPFNLQATTPATHFLATGPDAASPDAASTEETAHADL
jgi:hypothetical protein